MKLKVKISKPESGWINLLINSKDFTLKFEASDVPNNCINDLIESLILIESGIDSKVEFHLEPKWYSIEFKKVKDDFVLIANADSKSKLTGKFEEIILPFYRALKELISLNWKENDWPEINSNGIMKFEKEVKKRKAENNV